MLHDHNSAQSHQEERQEKPPQYALNYDVVPLLSHRQKIDRPLGEKNVGAEEQSIAKDRSFRNGVLLGGALQWLG